MELRVWVDGTQRVVCGVKLTTTCQEIVFALAHATQQAGRFTMIERWRNNERLLSPNEQPLVTLQRWGDHMNEVEFILRKTSSEIPPPNPSPLPQQPQQLQQRHNNINNQPPAVPAKPRVVSSLSMPLQQTMQPVNNAQINHHFYQQRPTNQSPSNLYHHNNLRPRHPPGYLDFMEAMASRNSLPQLPPLIPNPAYAQQSQHAQSNIFHRSSFDHQQVYNMQRYGSSPVNAFPSNNTVYRYSTTNGHSLPQNNHETNGSGPSGLLSANPIRPKLIDTGPLVINRGSAVNVKLHPSSQNVAYHSLANHERSLESTPSHTDAPQNSINGLVQNETVQSNDSISNKSVHNNSTQNNTSLGNNIAPINKPQSNNTALKNFIRNDTTQGNNSDDSSALVSQLGHDMLKVIEEQKKVLINQKNELERLDNGQECLETKQSNGQTELVKRIENEIHQLEQLWKENQAQIRKLENQDFEKVLKELKAEQVRMESEIEMQKCKLSRCENEIVQCKNKIEQLEADLANQELELEDASSNSNSSSCLMITDY